MAELEKLKKKLTPLFDAEKGFSSGSGLDPSDSYMVKPRYPRDYSIMFLDVSHAGAVCNGLLVFPWCRCPMVEL